MAPDSPSVRAGVVRGLTLLLVTFATAGCSTWQTIPFTAQAPPAPSVMPGDLELRTSDGRTLTLHDWTLEGDTLRGIAETQADGAIVMQSEALPVGSVVLVDGGLEGESLQKQLEAEQAKLAATRDSGLATPEPPQLPSEVRVRLKNGTSIELSHAFVDGDSLRGRIPATAAANTSRLTAIAMKDVARIESSRFHFGTTLGLMLGIGLVVAGIALVAYILGGPYE